MLPSCVCTFCAFVYALLLVMVCTLHTISVYGSCVRVYGALCVFAERGECVFAISLIWSPTVLRLPYYRWSSCCVCCSLVCLSLTRSTVFAMRSSQLLAIVHCPLFALFTMSPYATNVAIRVLRRIRYVLSTMCHVPGAVRCSMDGVLRRLDSWLPLTRESLVRCTRFRLRCVCVCVCVCVCLRLL
jgi:hypothetical protein